jgi:hypothetical protein
LANAASNSGRPGARDVPCVIQPGRLLHGDGVAERIAELCCGKGHRSLPVRRIAQDREGGAQLRGREHQYALDRRRIDCDCGGGEILAEQALGDQAAERMPDDYRLCRADDAGIVLDNIGDAPACRSG